MHLPCEPKQCWGDCGHLLVFATMNNGWRHWVVAFQICTGEAHQCSRARKYPHIFLPAMNECGVPVECNYSHRMIYGMPTRPKNQEEEIIWFDELAWPWTTHDCPIHNNMLPGMMDFFPKNLSQQCQILRLPNPFKLVIIVCVKQIGRSPLFVVALKSVLGELSCYNFRGDEEPRWGDLAVLCGSGNDQKLLTNTNCVLAFDGPADPAQLNLSTTGTTTPECKLCRSKIM